MKTFFRYFLFLALCSCCYTASAGTDDDVGYIVGNNYGVGPSDQNGERQVPMEMLPSNSGMVQAPII
ncbi:fimbrial adhesin YadC precursor [Escherichia coli]|jgi:hypothetical protein|uniref:Fimbrial adhesin YadC n=1 Tax=Escherichia coli TaxID=562 RepID=A0A376W0Z7_ECOLX|nr:hypothetical protein A13I_02754 [Escherichia coli KTE186]GCW36935.1 hypothetical protein HmCmsJML108_03622 [Escherichia coli]STC86275.1 fimbrial adhesin YadC precursor [Escherichia coli]STJ16704.1 fimbrial adhesin YadC precursor [Escherichia coli]